MSLKDKLKSIDILRLPVKRIKNYMEFIADAKDFSDNYAEMVEKNGDYRYRLMLLIHNLEKGMCRKELRPFGKDKAKKMVDILSSATPNEQDLFEYRLARAMLIAWKEFYEEKGWDLESNICSKIETLCDTDLIAGRESLKNPKEKISSGLFSDIIFSRRSIRDYSDKPLKQKDIDYALDCFVEAPTACNRQMCKVYRIKEKKKKDILCNTILGIGGFNTEVIELFLITYDIGAFEFYGERNQGYVNVGLVAMNFVNGLHARGIGSCFMQWSNNRTDDKMIRRTLGIPDRERIGIIVGAGYYKDEVTIPCSTRRNREDIYIEL